MKNQLLISSGFTFVMFITEFNFAIYTLFDLVSFFAIDTIHFMNSVMEFDFFSIFWVYYVYSSHYV